MSIAESWHWSAFEQQSELRKATATKVSIGHALVDTCSSEQALAALIEHARLRGRPAHVITPNAQHIVLLNKDSRFRNIYDHADLVVPDGVSLLFAARFYGRVLRERVTGVDLFHDLCGRAAQRGLKVFLLGGRPGSGRLAAEALLGEYPGLQCTTYCPEENFEASEAGLQAVSEAVRAAAPDLLFVALGAPKQEYWIHEHGLKLGVPVCMGVGGSFEMVGGVVPRAPRWVQGAGCEWLYRLCREPRRMWRRYLIGNAEFLEIVMRQRLRRAMLHSLMRLAAGARFAAELREFGLMNQEPGTGILAAILARDAAHAP